jgi:uncharacterized membrane protein YGL010W
MRKIDHLLHEYGESHQNSLNKAIHWICVPIIFFSLIGLIWSIPPQGLGEFLGWRNTPFANYATLVLILVLIYYLSLSIWLSVGMMLFSVGCLFLARSLEIYLPISLWLFSLILFVLAWIGQFYGHKVEGKKPSFFKDLQFLLIGPAWLMHFIYRKLGIPY